MDNQKGSKSIALKDVLEMEIKIASMAVFAVYLLFLIINFFTYDGRCSNLIMEPGRPSCSYLYAVFVEPILGILFFAVVLSWIWIPLFAIITVALTAISSKKLN